MFTVKGHTKNTADRIYGEFVEKVAMDATAVIPAVVGSLLGGITSGKLAEKQVIQDIRNQAKNQLDNNYYTDIQRLLTDVKVTFTPINVIFNVNGQTFEIISAKEMNEEMKLHFNKKDSEYFVQLLANKMAIEMQMAERYFARQLLAPHIAKEASVLSSLEDNGMLEKVAATVNNRFNDQIVKVSFDLDLFRPFDTSHELTKMALHVTNVQEAKEILTEEDFEKKMRVVFLPDRVVFMYEDLIVEQMGVMSMNEVGYEAFKMKNKQFFKHVFLDEMDQVREQVMEKQAAFTVAPEMEMEEKVSSVNHIVGNDDFYKTAAALDEIIEKDGWVQTTMFDKEHYNVFEDEDTHPMLYDMILDDKYGKEWHLFETEALLKRVEMDFLDDAAIPDVVLNKLLAIQCVQSPNNTFFETPFAFEKYVRAINGKHVDISAVERNLEFEEVMFALQIAESICNFNIYGMMSQDVCMYVAGTFFEDDLRMVTTSLYDDDDPLKTEFFDTVNGYLMRMFKDKDSQNLYGEESAQARELTEYMAEAANTILEEKAHLLSVERPYQSARIVVNTYFHNQFSQYEEEEALLNTVYEIVRKNFFTAMFLHFKQEEAEYVILKVTE